MNIKKDYADYQSQTCIRIRVFITSAVHNAADKKAVCKAAATLAKTFKAAGLKAIIYEPRLVPLPYSRMKYEAKIEVEAEHGTPQANIVYKIIKADKGIIKVE